MGIKCNIVLTGFMGTGKTTAGRLAAEQMGWSFVDADDVIIERAGKPIPQIFAQDGEPVFRKIESEVCQSLAAREKVVIATGGGMLVNPDNRAVMQARGLVVCLTAEPDEIERRVGGDDNRPMLRGDWQALLETRRAAYAVIPYQIDTTGKTPSDVATEIVRLWQSLSVSQ